MTEMQISVLRQFGLRIEPEMAQYLSKQISQNGKEASALAVMGGDARTGVARRQIIATESLARITAAQVDCHLTKLT